jgi:rare lipoprotein A
VRQISAIFATGFLLAACSSTTPVSTGKKLCSGTARPYQINGKWYYPQDHYDYEEEGIASWYGPGFHTRPKSCGGKYNMNGISAAHKTLPIPSVVEVTNVQTGKSLRLVVDDRGPFVDDRIIDLSKGAAVALGVHQKGLAKVSVKALPEQSKKLEEHLSQYGRYGRHPEGRSWEAIYHSEIEGDSKHKSHHKPRMQEAVHKNSPTTPKPKLTPAVLKQETPLAEPQTAQTHFVQIGATRQKPKAMQILKTLQPIGRGSIQERNHSSGQKIYVVNLGPYSSKAKAKEALSTVMKVGHGQARIIQN